MSIFDGSDVDDFIDDVLDEYNIAGTDDPSSSNWWDSITDFFGNEGFGGRLIDFFTDNSGGLGSLAGALLIEELGLSDPKIDKVGYQGGIPEYQAVRRQTNPYDPDRRPGSGGRRYFTDLEYTSAGKNMGENAGSNNGSTNNYVPPPEPTDEPSMNLPPNQDNFLARGGLASLRGSLKNRRRMYASNPIGSTTPIQPAVDEVTSPIGATLPFENNPIIPVDEITLPIGSTTPIQPAVDEVTSPIGATLPFENNPIIPVDEITLPIGSTTPIQPAVDEVTSPNRDLPFDPRDRFRDQFRDRFRDSRIPRILQERLQRARPRFGFEEGGIAKLAKGRYLDGDTDGMADKVPATIDGKQPAALSDGEFVIPADVVSHLGNGNSDAGAKILEQMMARVRKERTGNKEQGKEIEARKMLPA